MSGTNNNTNEVVMKGIKMSVGCWLFFFLQVLVISIALRVIDKKTEHKGEE